MKHIVILLNFVLLPNLSIGQSAKLDRIDQCIEQRQYEEACALSSKYLEKALNKKKKDTTLIASLWYAKGRAYSNYFFRKNKKTFLIDEAIYAFKRAAGYDKTTYATKAINQISGLHPFLFLLSKQHLKSGDTESYYETAKRALTCNEFIYFNAFVMEAYQLDYLLIRALAKAAQLTNRNEEAIEFYQRLIKSGSSDKVIFEQSSHLYLALGDTTKAIQTLDYSTQTFPLSRELFLQKIDFLISLNMYEKAIKEIHEGLDRFSVEQDQAALYFIQGNCYDKVHSNCIKKEQSKAKKYFERAETAYQKAVLLSPKTFNYQFNLAALYYNKALQLGMSSEYGEKIISKAVRALEEVYTLDRNQKSIIKALKDIYNMTDQQEKLQEISRQRS